ncbi:MAG: Na(+)/H(+) antiporter subunit B [Calditrichia bacterium]
MQGMTFIVKTITRLLIGIIFLFGIYITLYGHLTPGGGFAGGIMLACGLILLTLAFGKDVALGKLSDFWASLLDNLGAFTFWLIAMLGYVGGYFFINFIEKSDPFGLFSSGTILINNIAIGIKVFASVFAAFLALTIFGRFVSGLVSTEDEE